MRLLYRINDGPGMEERSRISILRLISIDVQYLARRKKFCETVLRTTQSVLVFGLPWCLLYLHVYYLSILELIDEYLCISMIYFCPYMLLFRNVILFFFSFIFFLCFRFHLVPTPNACGDPYIFPGSYPTHAFYWRRILAPRRAKASQEKAVWISCPSPGTPSNKAITTILVVLPSQSILWHSPCSLP